MRKKIVQLTDPITSPGTGVLKKDPLINNASIVQTNAGQAVVTDTIMRIVRNSPIIFFTSRDDGSREMINNSAYKLTGYPLQKFIKGLPGWEGIIHKGDLINLKQIIQTAPEDGYEAEYRIFNKQGEVLWVRENGLISSRDDKSNPVKISGTIIDITKLKNEGAFDALTGLYNRRYGQRFMEDELRRIRRYPHPLTISIIDVDWFKNINDAYGHAAGDEVLQKIANTICEEIRSTDIKVRWGGDEFVIIFLETPQDRAVVPLGRLQKSISKIIFQFEKDQVTVGISMGTASITNGGINNWEEIFKAADRNLYQQKKLHHNNEPKTIDHGNSYSII
ncbi:MAG: sensor domain-containing diguanylate cyclase [Candidatus Margulisiibacteriota bacterium]